MMLCHQTKFGCERISSLEDPIERHILIVWSFTVTLALKTANQSFWRSYFANALGKPGSWWYNTMPGLVVKGSPVQRILSGQTFMGILKFCCDLELEHRNAISSQDSLANDNVLPNQVWYQKDQQLRRYSRNCHILIIWALVWPWSWK